MSQQRKTACRICHLRTKPARDVTTDLTTSVPVLTATEEPSPNTATNILVAANSLMCTRAPSALGSVYQPPTCHIMDKSQLAPRGAETHTGKCHSTPSMGYVTASARGAGRHLHPDKCHSTPYKTWHPGSTVNNASLRSRCLLSPGLGKRADFRFV